jgi:hypothetical protein
VCRQRHPYLQLCCSPEERVPATSSLSSTTLFARGACAGNVIPIPCGCTSLKAAVAVFFFFSFFLSRQHTAHVFALLWLAPLHAHCLVVLVKLQHLCLYTGAHSRIAWSWSHVFGVYLAHSGGPDCRYRQASAVRAGSCVPLYQSVRYFSSSLALPFLFVFLWVICFSFCSSSASIATQMIPPPLPPPPASVPLSTIATLCVWSYHVLRSFTTCCVVLFSPV